jgi:PAS domain S-box-containing protein
MTALDAESRLLHVAGDDSNLRRLVRDSRLPVWLLGLPTGRVIETSGAIASLMHSRRDQLLQRHVTEFVTEPALVRSRLGLLASGDLDSYRVHARTYRRPDGSEFDVDVCLSACTVETPRRMAVGVLLPVRPAPHTLSAGADRSGVIAMGTVDQDWRIDRISAGIESLLGYAASDVVGRQVEALVEPEDWPNLLIATGHGLRDQDGATTRLMLRTVDGRSRLCTAMITRLAGTAGPGFAFSVTAVDGTAPDVAQRAWELEGHIRRIAREIAASGVLAGLTGTPVATTVPAMAGLSTRELEIVTGLLGGERVPMMAARMFLSQSTVRNHLTSVYRKLGVHSQAELLTMLRAHSDASPSPVHRAYAEGNALGR